MVPPPPNTRNKRQVKGMKRCGKNCSACPYISEVRNIKINRKITWRINRTLNCNNFNVIYMLEWKKDSCKMRYIGETKRAIKHHCADHRGYIVNGHTDKATGAHFNLPGHSLADLTCRHSKSRFFCAVKTIVLKFCARKRTKISLKITLYL